MAEPARRARRARRARNGGYDTALRISTEPLSDNLKCNICMGILRDPVTVNASVCGHTYCRYCINVHVRRRRTCPDCRAPIALYGIVDAPPILQRLVNEIKVRCGTAYCEQHEFPNENACRWEGYLGDFDVHVDNRCKFGEVECPQGCGDIMERLLVDDHKARDCKETEIPCKFPGCEVQVTRGKEDVHLAESYLAHLSTMLPIVMQLQTTVTTLQGEAIALQRKATTHERNEAELKAKVTALESTMVTIANARQLLFNARVSRNFKFKPAGRGSVGDNGKSFSIVSSMPRENISGGLTLTRPLTRPACSAVDIEGPMPGMAPLELTVSELEVKLRYILFRCTGGRVVQELTVARPNVGDKVRIALLENGVLAAGIQDGMREPVVKPGWPANESISIRITFAFHERGDFCFTLQ